MYTRFTVWCSEVSRPKKHLPLLQLHHTPCKEDKKRPRDKLPLLVSRTDALESDALQASTSA